MLYPFEPSGYDWKVGPASALIPAKDRGRLGEEDRVKALQLKATVLLGALALVLSVPVLIFAFAADGAMRNVLLTAGVGLLGVSALFALIFAESRSRLKRICATVAHIRSLMARGETVQAEAAGKIETGRRGTARLVCRWTDPETGEAVEGVSWPLSRKAADARLGRSLNVFLGPAWRQGEFYVDAGTRPGL